MKRKLGFQIIVTATLMFLSFSSLTPAWAARVMTLQTVDQSAIALIKNETVMERYLENLHRRADYDLLIVVEEDKLDGIQSSLDQYVLDLEDDGISSHIITFGSGSAEDLKRTLSIYYAFHHIQGAFLIGDLPAAWAERIFIKYHDDGTTTEILEQFPTDLFLMDLIGSWQDRGHYTCYAGSCSFTATTPNDIYDTFPENDAREMEIFVSRLDGSEAELKGYFTKNHTFRTSGALLPRRSFLFVDDDWDFQFPDLFLLDTLYSFGQVDRLYAKSNTLRNKYLNYMENKGAEFVHQWIHSSPTTLFIHEPDHSTPYDVNDHISATVSANYVKNHNLKGSFFNLFDCSAHRFTETPMILSEAYLRTDYGLASVGSTKVGAMLATEIFNEKIGAGDYWGTSFQEWYNETGKSNDRWHLGMSIMGDPMLTLSGYAMAKLPPIFRDPYKHLILDRVLDQWITKVGPQLGTFREYMITNPKFFKPWQLERIELSDDLDLRSR